jgi:hypothetical protein
MKILTFNIASMVLMTGVASGQIGYTLQQCTAKYGPVVATDGYLERGAAAKAEAEAAKLKN